MYIQLAKELQLFHTIGALSYFTAIDIEISKIKVTDTKVTKANVRKYDFLSAKWQSKGRDFGKVLVVLIGVLL